MKLLLFRVGDAWWSNFEIELKGTQTTT